MDILEDLKFRNLIHQVSDYEGLKSELSKGPLVLYCGYDPSADSLHIGHLLTILTLRRFQLAGYSPILLLGGATGLIGDPAGKSAERPLEKKEVIESNEKKIKKQLENFFDFSSKSNPAKIISNKKWLSEIKMLDFLREIGKYFSVGEMLAKESVKSRLSTGISFTEFTYMLLQAYDFLRLAKDFDCKLQVGGSDQWGNITAGIDLVRKVLKRPVFGLTIPLLIKSDGTKFGKTEAGQTIWLNCQKTSPYQLYQFFINSQDRDVVKFLKYFTFLAKEEILNLEKEVKKNPEKRLAQNVLAREITKIVHSKEAVLRAEKISKALFYGRVKELSEKEIEEAFSDVPSKKISAKKKLNLVDLLIESGVSKSKRQAREDIENGAIFVNDKKLAKIDEEIAETERLFGKYLVLRRGKKNYYLVLWT